MLEVLSKEKQKENKTPVEGAYWAADCAFLSQGCIVTSTIMNKIRQVSLLKRGTIGIIFNWGPTKYSMTV